MLSQTVILKIFNKKEIRSTHILLLQKLYIEIFKFLLINLCYSITKDTTLITK